MQRGIRGAVLAKTCDKNEIISAAQELVLKMAELNDVSVEEISHIIFTVTPDIRTAFPGSAVRLLGAPWNQLAVLDFAQADIEGALPRVIRALMSVETSKSLKEIVHPYLRGAHVLRPDRESN